MQTLMQTPMQTLMPCFAIFLFFLYICSLGTLVSLASLASLASLVSLVSLVSLAFCHYQLESPKQFQLHDPCATVWVGSTMAQCKKFLDVSKFHENENVGDLGHYANAVWRVFENQQCDLFSKTFGFGV